jgi:hypothetical protein
MQTFWVKLTQELDHKFSFFLQDWNQNQHRETKSSPIHVLWVGKLNLLKELLIKLNSKSK